MNAVLISGISAVAAFMAGVSRLQMLDPDTSWDKWGILAASSLAFGFKTYPDIMRLCQAMQFSKEAEASIAGVSMFGPAFIGACLGTAYRTWHQGKDHKYKQYYCTTNYAEVTAACLTALDYLGSYLHSSSFEYKCTKVVLSGFIGIVIGMASEDQSRW